MIEQLALNTCIRLHQNYESGLKANATALTILQVLAGGTVAILSAISASKEDSPNVLNILSAVFGAVSAGLSGLSKWRDYAGKATFHNNAVLFYDGCANQADNTMQASKQFHNYLPNKLLKAVNLATEVIQPPRRSPGLQFATKIKARWKWLDIGFGCCAAQFTCDR